MEYRVRAARPDDINALARIFRESVLQIEPGDYTPEQIAAWASFADDTDDFVAWINGATTLVAVDLHDECLGFGGLEAQGRVASLYVAPDAMRQGIASDLLRRLMEEARESGLEWLTTEASEFSKPVFERLGFMVAEVECAEYKGVDFIRYRMRARADQQSTGAD